MRYDFWNVHTTGKDGVSSPFWQSHPLDHQSARAKFIVALVAGSATVVAVYPMTLCKLRMQLHGQWNSSAILFVWRTLRNDGFRGLYVGLTAALTRSPMHATRLAVYNYMVEEYKSDPNFTKDRGYTKTLICTAMVSGALTNIIGMPGEVVLTRICLDKYMPPSVRRNYRNCFDGIRKIIKNEGFFALFTGIIPSTIRNALLSVSQFVVFTNVIELLSQRGYHNTYFKNMIAGSLSGTLSTVVTLPFDTIKTRIQYMRQRHLIGTLRLGWLTRHHGVLGLWAGFSAYSWHITPWTMLFLSLDTILSASYAECRQNSSRITQVVAEAIRPGDESQPEIPDVKDPDEEFFQKRGVTCSV